MPNELRVYATRRLLLQRVRACMVVCAAGGVVFGGKELLIGNPGAQFWTQVLGTTMAVTALLALRTRWALRWAWPLAVFVVSAAYVMTAIAGMLSPTGEYGTTAVLFVGAALTTAMLVPWGVWPQIITVSVGGVSLAVAVYLADGSLGVLITDPGAATLIGFVWSGVAVREVTRYRLGHRRELLMRRRGELAIKRLNARLEQRVAERTAALQRTNETLAREAAERIESQRRLADTIDHSNAVIALKDPNGRYLLVNREFEAMLEVRRGQVIGRADGELFAAEMAERLGARDAEVLRTGTAVSFEQTLTVGGVERSYVTVKFPLHDAAGAPYGVGSVATDITPLKQLQEEARQRQDDLAHVLRLHTITEMAAGLAHEINQPLCAITNYAQGGVQRLRGGRAEPGELLDAFEQIAAEGLRAGQIIRGVRNLVQRTSSGSEPIDMNGLATEAVRVIEARARQHGVTVRLESGQELPRIWADAVQIQQVMLNLMLNGVEAMEGTSSGRCEVVVATQAWGGGVEVAVSDTGAGLAPSVADKLFTAFCTTKPGGLGLGLAISRSIVELHGGRLWAARNSGGGMTFGFWLPCAPGKRPEAQDGAHPRPLLEGEGTTGRKADGVGRNQCNS